MNHHASYIVAIVCCTIWNIFVFSGTVYLIGWQGWSPWWFIIPIVLFMGTSSSKKEDDD